MILFVMCVGGMEILFIYEKIVLFEMCVRNMGILIQEKMMVCDVCRGHAKVDKEKIMVYVMCGVDMGILLN